MTQSRCGSRAEIAQFELLVMQEYVLHFDIPVSNGWLLIMHVQHSSAQIFQHVHHLLFLQAFAAKLDNQVEKCAICAQFGYYGDLVSTWLSLLNLRFVNLHYVIVATKSPLFNCIRES